MNWLTLKDTAQERVEEFMASMTFDMDKNESIPHGFHMLRDAESYTDQFGCLEWPRTIDDLEELVAVIHAGDFWELLELYIACEQGMGNGDFWFGDWWYEVKMEGGPGTGRTMKSLGKLFALIAKEKLSDYDSYADPYNIVFTPYGPFGVVCQC